MARRKIPFVPQMEAVECGAACLTMVLRGFGHYAELSEVREKCGVSRDGVSARQLVRVAREYHLTPKARRLEPADLAAVTDPAILHWEMNHFVLLERWTPQEVRLIDPAVGPRRISAADFSRAFTGICIELVPGESFEKRPPSPLSLRRLVDLLRQARGALAAIVLSSLLLSLLGFAVPMTTKLIVDRVIVGRQHTWLDAIGVSGVALVALLFVTMWLRSSLVGRVRDHLDASMGSSLVRHMLSLPVRFFEQRHTADLVSRVDGVRIVRELLAERAVSLFVDGPLLFTYLAVLFGYSTSLALVIAGAALAYVAVYAATRPPQLAALRERMVKDVRAAIQLLQTLRGVVTLKSSGRELGAHERWLRLFVHALNAATQEARVRLVADAFLLAIRLAAPAIVLILGAERVLAGDMTMGELMAVTLLAALFLGPLETAAQSLLRLQELPLHLARMDDVLQTAVERTGSRPCPPLEGDIRFENVTFRYGPTAPPALDGLSFSIRRGEKVAFVGPSGSGKSTVAKLILGLHAPESGSITFDGLELDALDLDSVRRQMGAVLQETAVFEGTLRENIALYHRTAPLDDVVAAARVAQLHADIQSLPLGYDTQISNQSGPLSGGQRQRLSLARAVLHRPPILVLDEATSALDTSTELAVDAYLTSRSCTRVVIAHRLSTVRDADKIFVVDGGKIVEQGRHDELLVAGGVYSRLAMAGDASAQRPSERSRSPERVTAADLAKFEALAEMSDADRATLAAAIVRRVVAEGASLVHRGDRGPGLFFVERGELDVVLEEPGLPKQKVGSVSAGAMLGEVSLLDGSPVSATIVATERAEVLHLPVREVERLRADGDVLAVRLTLALGRILATRLRAKTEERAKLGRAAGPDRADDKPSESTARVTTGLRLEQTALGASFTAAELARADGLGQIRRYAPGEALFLKGDPGDCSHLVLGGRIAVRLDEVEGDLNVIKAGELLGEVALFDPGPRSANCVAIGAAVTFTIDHQNLRNMLVAGDSIAQKILRHLAHGLVRAFRISDLRLREAMALGDGEEERASRAHDEARALADSRDLSLTTDEEDGRVPVVASDAALSAAACVTALLRHAGRPIPFTAVAEACAEDGGVTPASLARGARSFGLLIRKLALDPSDLRRLDGPLVVELTGGRYAVAERWRAGRLELASPTDGRKSLTPRELEKSFLGTAFELRVDDAGRGSFRERVVHALRSRRRALVHIWLAALGIQLAGLAFPIALSLVLGRALPYSDLGVLRAIALGLGAATLVHIALSVQRNTALLYLRTHLDSGLLDQLFRHVLALRIEFFERSPSGTLLARFEAFRIVRELIGNQGLSAALDVPVLLLALIAMAALDLPLFGLVLGTTLVIGAALALLAPRLRALAAEEMTSSAAQRTRLVEVLAGVVTLRVTGTRALGLERWLPSALRSLRAATGQERAQGAWHAFAEFARLGTVAVGTWWGASRVVRGELELGTMLGFMGVAGAYLLALREVGSHLVAYSRAARRIALVAQTFEETPEQLAATRLSPGRLRGRIQLERVSFSYDKDSGDVLTDVSFDIEPGTKVALVGASGSGKSTLGKLLLGFYLPRSGRVLFDGRDAATLDLAALRSQLGVVLQDGQLFSGSVRENVAISAPDASIEHIIEAAKLADIHDTIVELPMGYETIVAEGGGSFSGGQRQRLTLARALVHQPAVLLLDEATSALDNLSQSRIEDALTQLSSTRIVIAHRLSTVVDADQIVVLDQGRIVERGRHTELMDRKGHYFRLAQGQLA